MASENWHMTFWWNVKCEAAETLARVCCATKPCTETEVNDLLAYAIKCGSPCDVAEAITAASKWTQANNEIRYKQEEVK